MDEAANLRLTIKELRKTVKLLETENRNLQKKFTKVAGDFGDDFAFEFGVNDPRNPTKGMENLNQRKEEFKNPVKKSIAFFKSSKPKDREQDVLEKSGSDVFDQTFDCSNYEVQQKGQKNAKKRISFFDRSVSTDKGAKLNNLDSTPKVQFRGTHLDSEDRKPSTSMGRSALFSRNPDNSDCRDSRSVGLKNVCLTCQTSIKKHTLLLECWKCAASWHKGCLPKKLRLTVKGGPSNYNGSLKDFVCESCFKKK